jgi:predicted permease
VQPSGERFINADQRSATARYFETMRIPLLRGRGFTDQDLRSQPRVVVIDEHMARSLWPNDDPIGGRIKFGDERSESPWETVVGVVGNVKQYALDSDSRIALYRPHTQSPARSLFMVVRTGGEPEALVPAITHAIRAFDRDVPVYRVRTMDDRVRESLARRRFSMLLLGVFAGLALVLAAVGVYGVTAYLVRQGVREIGIRIALGATSAAIVGHVLRPALVATIAGLAAGLAGALILTRALGSLLFGVAPTDPPTFAAIAALLGVVAIVAGYVPAHRATRINPLISLRTE